MAKDETVWNEMRVHHSADQSAITSSASWTTIVGSGTELDEDQTTRSSEKIAMDRENRRERDE